MSVSRQAVSKWECGQSCTDINKLINLSKLFKISIDDLEYIEGNFDENKEIYKNDVKVYERIFHGGLIKE